MLAKGISSALKLLIDENTVGCTGKLFRHVIIYLFWQPICYMSSSYSFCTPCGRCESSSYIYKHKCIYNVSLPFCVWVCCWPEASAVTLATAALLHVLNFTIGFRLPEFVVISAFTSFYQVSNIQKLYIQSCYGSIVFILSISLIITIYSCSKYGSPTTLGSAWQSSI